MIRRTRIAIDQDLLNRAQEALGEATMRGTIEQALRRVVENVETERLQKAARQRRYLDELPLLVDPDLLASDEVRR